MEKKFKTFLNTVYLLIILKANLICLKIVLFPLSGPPGK